jgi:hypothetical protein
MRDPFPLSVRDTKNPKGLASRLIDDEVRKNPVEKNLPAREIGAAVPAVWDVGQLIETFDLRLAGRDPNGQPKFVRCASLNAASLRRASSGPHTRPAVTCSRARSIFFIERAPFFVGPVLFSVQRFKGAANHILGVSERTSGQALLHQGLNIWGNVQLHA